MPYWGEEGFQWVAGAGSELYRGLGSVVLGGLIVSTVFTLVLIPIAFSLAVDLKKAFAHLFGLRSAELAAAERGRPQTAATLPAPEPAPELAVAGSPEHSTSLSTYGESRRHDGDGNGNLYEFGEEPEQSGGGSGQPDSETPAVPEPVHSDRR
jgi:hypothetical protein